MPPALLASPEQLLATSIRTVVIYALAVLLVRLVGRRTLAQISAYDVVVTVAAGTVVGSAALPSSPTVSDGVVVILTLFALQAALGAVRQRVPAVRRLVDFAPEPVVRDGEPDLRRRPTTAQLTRSELESQLRRQGVSRLQDVRLAVLEPTGQVSVLRTDERGDLFASVR